VRLLSLYVTLVSSNVSFYLLDISYQKLKSSEIIALHYPMGVSGIHINECAVILMICCDIQGVNAWSSSIFSDLLCHETMTSGNRRAAFTFNSIRTDLYTVYSVLIINFFL
jgi:hypothetical protein